MSYFLDFFQSLFDYREYLWQSVLRDLRKKYKRSVLGYFWSMLQPLLMMLILAIVFSNIMKIQIDDYAVFLFCGMLPWSFFSQTALVSLHGISANANIINQLPVPKYLFIVSIAASTFVHFLLSLVPLFLIMIVLGHPISPVILLLPLVLLLLIIVTLGVSLILSVANVFFDDTQHLAGVALQALYFLSPVLYARDQLPQWLIKWLVINPMFPIIEFMRNLVFDGVMFSWTAYFISLFSSLVILLISLIIFRRAQNKFIYFI